MRERIGWIDALRGFAILLIVLGHAFSDPSPIENWVYACHIPLFLLISGMVFSPGESFGRFAWKRFRTIMVPYFCFGTISILIYALLGKYAEGAMLHGLNVSPLWQNVLNLLWGNAKDNAMRWNRPLWFLPMFFLMTLVAHCLLRRSSVRRMLAALCACIAAAWLAGGWLSRLNLPWHMETVPFLLPFLLIGRLLREALPALERSKPVPRFFAGAALLALGIVLVPLNGRVTYSGDSFGRSYGLFVLIALLFCGGLVSIASLRCQGFAPLNAIGQSTLGILVTHKFPIEFFNVIPIVRTTLEAHRVIAPMFTALVSLGMCMIAVRLLRKIAPWSIGIQERS